MNGNQSALSKGPQAPAGASIASAVLKPKKANAKYYGRQEVTDIKEDPDNTGFVILTLASGKTVTIAESEKDNLVLDHEIDESELRSKRTMPVCLAILTIMKKYNIRHDEVEYVLGLVAQSVNDSATHATNKLWGVDNYGEIAFLQLDKTIKS